MPGRTHKPYPEEFKKKLIGLVREGRTPEALSKQFEPSAQAIRNWVVQADRDEGKRRAPAGDDRLLLHIARPRP